MPLLSSEPLTATKTWQDSSVLFSARGLWLPALSASPELQLFCSLIAPSMHCSAPGGLLPDTVKLAIQWKLHGGLLPATVLFTNVTFVQVSLTEQPRCAPDFAPLLPTKERFLMTVGGYPTGSLSPVW